MLYYQPNLLKPSTINQFSQIPNQYILQKNVQLNKQKVEQKLDSEYNTYALGRALSKAELYAFRFSNDKAKEIMIRPLFGYYNQFDNGNNFEKEELFKSLVNAVKCVHYGFEETEYKYKEIMLPDNMKKEDVIKYIGILKTFLTDPKETRIYDALISVLERLQLDFSDYTNLYSKNQIIDQKRMMESFPGINKIFEAKEKKWKTRIENDPDYKPKFELGKNYDENSEFQIEYLKRLDYK